jgi:MFS superfamily sulfate permease-like transporter
MWERLRLFLNPFDGRYEDLRNGSWHRVVFRDFTAGLIVAMVAIPLAMGFAMASGLRPEHGIVGGAIAGLIGALFGGSKYQVYGPTAAFIPVIAGLMTAYGSTPETYAEGHGFLVLAALLAGGVLMLMGLFGLGRFVSLVPHSIVVGFTIGIAVTIGLSQIGEVLGLKAKLGYRFLDKCQDIAANLGEWNGYALVLALLTFVLTKYLLRISVYIPAPLLALGLGVVLTTTIWSGHGLTTVAEKYGRIPTDFLVFTPPRLPDAVTSQVVFDLVYFALAIVFVSAVESLLCSRMADRLADNRGQPFNPNKELWGQGWVNTVVPLLNGFPHTGALARTATNIKLGALTPLAGIFKCVLKLLLAAYLAVYLEMVPMACIGGILLYVAINMVKPEEVRQVLRHNRFHVVLMLYTAIMVIVTDFLTGVLTAVVLYAALYRFFDRPPTAREEQTLATVGDEVERDGRADGRQKPQEVVTR